MNNTVHKDTSVQELAEKISQVFSIYDIQQEDGNIYFFGIPKEARIAEVNDGNISNRLEPKIVYQKLWAIFAEKGYQFSYKRELGEDVLIASPFKPVRERYWINVVLLLATLVTTMVVGSFLFGADIINTPSEIVRGAPFTVAIMAVLGSHEAGHYIVARRHGMRTSLPYFIPFPSLIGTMGAVIKHRGPIPNRKALFDVGISGPLVGLIVSIVVTIIGLLQPPVAQASEGFQIQLGIPPLFEFITRFLPFDPGTPIHPIAFAGWIGMLITALNLIPSGQLDGGHVLRSMVGEKASYVSTALPFLLIGLGFYVTYFQNQDGFMWVFWGLLLSLFAAAGHPKPLNDEDRVGNGRMVLGVIVFALGLLCVTLVPIQVQ